MMIEARAEIKGYVMRTKLMLFSEERLNSNDSLLLNGQLVMMMEKKRF